MIPRDASGSIRNRRSKIRKASRAIWGRACTPLPSETSLRVRSSEPRTFSIKGQSSLDEQSNLFIESSRPVVSILRTKRQRPIIEQRREYFFAARVHMEQYKSECAFTRNREGEKAIESERAGESEKTDSTTI